MKPLLLSLQAFGPFSSRISVDFSRLDSSSLCLVHGATGAGKTTLLDGICFALYGSTSGGERTAKQMRCDAAPERVRTEVEFLFSSKKKRYRIVRAPEQRRKKRKGDGTTDAKAEVRLFIAVDHQAKAGNDEHWELLFAKSSPVDDEIQRILGLSADQFRQVALLPQGQFRSFLLATSQEREDILEALFHTERFSRLKDVLLGKERALRKDLEDSEKKRQAWLEQMHAETEEEIQEELGKVSTLSQQMAEEMVRLAGSKDLQQKQLLLARDDLRRHHEWKEAEQAHQKLEASSSAFIENSARLHAAERAEHSRVPVEAFLKEEAAVNSQSVVVTKLEVDIEKVAGLLENVRKDHNRAQENLLPVDEMREQLVGLKNLMESAKQTQKMEAHLLELQRRHAELQCEKNALQETVEQLAKEELEQRNLYEKDLLAAQSLERHREALVHLSLRTQQRKELEASRAAVVEHHEILEETEAATTLLLGKLGAIREKLAAEDALIIAEAVTALRMDLEPEHPCPVCGSSTHVLVAKEDKEKEHTSITKRNRLKNQLTKAEQAHHDGQEKRVKAARDMAASEERVRSFLATLGADAERTLDDMKTSEQDRMQIFAKSEAAYDRLSEHKKAKETFKKAQAKAEEMLLQMQPTLQTTLEKRLRLEGALLVKNDVRPLAELKRAAKNLEKQIEKRIREHQKTTLLLNETETKQGLLMERLETEEAHLLVVNEQKKYSKVDMKTSLLNMGFVDFESWTRDLLSPEARSKLSENVQKARRERAVVQARLQETEKNRPQEIPSVEDEERAFSVLDHALQKAKGEQGELNVRRRQLEELTERLSTLRANHGNAKSQYEQVARLTRQMVGDNARKLPFQRFVVGRLFDGVLHAASRRLEKMTRGRFALMRVEAEGKGRGYRGLDLNVVDNRTQTMRPVATLSGGESFLAALSLSLGLADAVREKTGGVELDSVFLDEGFAGLDPESLEDALAALEGLARGGRLVVVVSHVDELKERISSRIEVSGGALGSGVRLFLPHDVDVEPNIRPEIIRDDEKLISFEKD
ncbi:MAG: SMC family ATPase [Deltaproteobacteria bacterium]|nr:SMC family ATPase [Deltaproteobacteria bacterium]